MKKYKQVYTYIYDEYIKNKEVGSKIPPEIEIAKNLDVSRMTVNKAVHLLVDSGFLKRVKGQGTYIISHDEKFTKDLDDLLSYSEEMEKRNVIPTTDLLSYKCTKNIPREIRYKMKIEDENQSLHYIERLRYSEGVPISLDVTYVNSKFVEVFDMSKVTKSLFQYYEDDLKIEIGYADQLISAVLAGEKRGELLRVSPGEPLIKIESLNYTTEEEIFEFSTVYYTANAYQIKKKSIRKNSNNLSSKK